MNQRRSGPDPQSPGADAAPYIPLPDGLAAPRQTAGMVFDSIAAVYDRVRPRYPAEAVDDLIGACVVSANTRIVEIGCGTGQLTMALTRTGASILAAEPGAALAALARANLADHPAIEVRATRFEELDASPGSFDVVVAATSFHWIDPAVGYPKAAVLLRPGGFLVLLTNAHSAGGNHSEPAFADAVRQLHHRLAPRHRRLDLPDHRPGHRASHLTRRHRRRLGPNRSQPRRRARRVTWFHPPTIRVYPWTASYERDDYLDLLASQSTYALMDAHQRTALLEGIGSLVDDLLGGRVTKQYLTVTAAAQAK